MDMSTPKTRRLFGLPSRAMPSKVIPIAVYLVNKGRVRETLFWHKIKNSRNSL